MAANTYFQLQNMAALITMLLLVESIGGLVLVNWALKAYRTWRNRAARTTPNTNTDTVVVVGIPSHEGHRNPWCGARRRAIESAQRTARHRAEVLAFRLDGVVEDDSEDGLGAGRYVVVRRWDPDCTVLSVVEWGAVLDHVGQWAPSVDTLHAWGQE